MADEGKKMMKSLTQIANHLTVYDRNGGVNVPRRWFMQNRTRYLESKTEKLTVPVEGPNKTNAHCAFHKTNAPDGKRCNQNQKLEELMTTLVTEEHEEEEDYCDGDIIEGGLSWH